MAVRPPIHVPNRPEAPMHDSGYNRARLILPRRVLWRATADIVAERATRAFWPAATLAIGGAGAVPVGCGGPVARSGRWGWALGCRRSGPCRIAAARCATIPLARPDRGDRPDRRRHAGPAAGRADRQPGDRPQRPAGGVVWHAHLARAARAARGATPTPADLRLCGARPVRAALCGGHRAGHGAALFGVGGFGARPSPGPESGTWRRRARL
jgi:hypothetical protein